MSIELRTEMVAMLDEVFKNGALTSILDTDGQLVQAGANAKEIKVAKMELDGLADLYLKMERENNELEKRANTIKQEIENKILMILEKIKEE